MLSAFAARKATQASRQTSTTTEPTREPSPLPSESPPKPPASKRKPSEQGTGNPRKKTKKNQEKQPKTARYFEEVVQEEVVSSESESEPPTRRWSPSIPIHDSSDEDQPPIATEPVASSSKPPISTFQPILDVNLFYLSSEEQQAFRLPPSESSACLLSLQPNEQVRLLGVYSLAVVRGSISIAGVQLSPSRKTHRVFAPKSSPLPVLIAQGGASTIVDTSGIPPRLQPAFREGNAVIFVQELHTDIEGLGLVCRTFDRVFSPSHTVSNDINLTGIHFISEEGQDIQPYHLPSSWTQALSNVSSESGIYLVKGTKRVGKSTFARTLVNNLLTRFQKVAYLECDLGQSEFTPCGMVALNVVETPLFGPPFTHPTLPLAAHYIGGTSPQSSPSHYLTAIQSLVHHYRLEIQNPLPHAIDQNDERISETIPLVINTMGWTKGLGADLTRKIEESVECTHIFEFDAPFSDNTLQGLVSEYPSEVQVHTIEHIPSSMQSGVYNAADYRTLSILSYFHAVFPRTIPEGLVQTTAQRWDVSLPLCAKRPYQVDFRVAIDKVVLTGAGSEDVQASEIGRVLNGAIVGLVSCEPGGLDEGVPPPSESLSPIPYTQDSSVPPPTLSNCFGLGLIRAVTPQMSHMHLLCPLPPSQLAMSRVLVKGEVEIPVWGMLDFRSDSADGVAGAERGKVPFLQWGKGEGIGAAKRRIRRNLMRKGQM